MHVQCEFADKDKRYGTDIQHVHCIGFQVELLLRRAVNDRQQKIYTLACVENLEYNVAEKAEQSFDTLCRGADRGTMKLI